VLLGSNVASVAASTVSLKGAALTANTASGV
jgi:hypothetical protein